MREEVKFVNDLNEGIYKRYYENGYLETEANYRNGKKEGISKTYHENGRVAFMDTFKNGLKISRESYDKYGKLIK